MLAQILITFASNLAISVKTNRLFPEVVEIKDSKVSREEILHIANLARLDLEENEIDKYLENLDDILNFAEIVNNAPVEGLDITIGANEAKNVFRKDEVKVFGDTESLLQNAESTEQGMFKIPKVI